MLHPRNSATGASAGFTPVPLATFRSDTFASVTCKLSIPQNDIPATPYSAAAGFVRLYVQASGGHTFRHIHEGGNSFNYYRSSRFHYIDRIGRARLRLCFTLISADKYGMNYGGFRGGRKAQPGKTGSA